MHVTSAQVSCEEVRWAEMQGAMAGKTPVQLRSELTAAVAAKERDFNALIRVGGGAAAAAPGCCCGR
jgi:hypothetical protein